MNQYDWWIINIDNMMNRMNEWWMIINGYQ